MLKAKQMEQVHSLIEAQLPCFSLVLETENLANADLNGLSRSLASLVNQDVSPTSAAEVLLIDSGDIPVDLLEQLSEKYPWITVHHAALGTGYYKAKMLGAQLATAEIVVYFDSDCTYEPTWLRNILTAFTQSEDIQVVAGETMTRGVGWYGTAMALTYIFPPYSGQNKLTETSQYFLNNVAFRRNFLLKYPIPSELPLYRGNCTIHAHSLRNSGYKIWRQPQARATHAPPNGFSHFFWRFLLIGHDAYWQNRLLKKANSLASRCYRDPVSEHENKLRIFSDRLQKILIQEPRHLLYLPFSIPAILAALALIVAGYLITFFKPKYLLYVYNRIIDDF
jgi:glycosyltransferase involved in cell wall biosynthesis